MDKDRSFTASAPPGARPPCRKPSATSIMQFDDSDGGDERDYGVEPRRETSAPVTRPPRSCSTPSGRLGLLPEDDGEEEERASVVRRPPRR